jgi:hypothetical protein
VVPGFLVPDPTLRELLLLFRVPWFSVLYLTNNVLAVQGYGHARDPEYSTTGPVKSTGPAMGE